MAGDALVHQLISLLVFLLLLLASSSCYVCAECEKSHTFNGEKKLFANCNNLGIQNASIAWSFETANHTIQVLFSGTAPSTDGWVGWGLNPSSPVPVMVGTQAFIAFRAPNGSTLLTYNVTDDTKAGAPLSCSPISLHVLDMAVEISGTHIRIFVSFQLPRKHSSLLNHVWNRGSAVTNFRPAMHDLSINNLSGLKTINMSSAGIIMSGATLPPHSLLKNRHAVLNTVGWGILLPMGVIAARYLRPLTDPAWFYVHVFLQITGYTLGVAGWATGLQLGSYSGSTVFKKHRFVGIVLFSIATSQMMALLLRPNKDHTVRRFWNLYHYALGISILILGIFNIFVGFDILMPQSKWRHAYIGVLGALAGASVIFEITSWWIHSLSKNHSSKDKIHGATAATRAYKLENGYRG